MRRFLIAVLAPLFLLTVAFSAPGPIVIGDDDGGSVDEHVKFYARIMASGVPVRVEGICVSACTIVLWLPKSQVCVAPTASFGFHAARFNQYWHRTFTEAMARRYYPEAIRKWIKEHDANVPIPEYMTAEEVVAADVLAYCDPPLPAAATP
jgi:hypothetical protein